MNKEEATIHDYIKVLRKRKWTIITVFLTFFLVTTAATLLTTPVYRATAQVYIDPGTAAQYTFQQSQTIDTNSYIQTQMGILKSESLAYKVVTALGLDKQAGGGGGVFSELRGTFSSKEPPNPTTAAVKNFLAHLRVDSVKNSNLVRVSFEHSDPQEAARIVNAHVNFFIEQNLEMKVAPARKAMEWLNDKLTEMKSKMSESAGELEEFKRSRDLITDTRQANISLQALGDLNTKALSAEAERYKAETKWEQVQKLSRQPDGLMALPEVINNRLIMDLKAQQGNLNKEIADNSKRYGERHPQMIRLKSELESIREHIDAEVQLIVDSIKNDYNTTVRAEQRLKGALSNQKFEAMSYERRSGEYEMMKQDVEGSKNIYDAVLKKFQESNLMGNMNMSNVQLLDKAVPPDDPVRPKKSLNIMLGFFFGIFAGVGFAFVFEHLDNTYKTPEDLEESIGLPFLGLVPSNKQLHILKKQEDSAIFSNPKQPVSEAFRNVRSNLMLASGDVKPQVLQICSAIHSEGKTTVAINLAGIMAAAGEKVLIIDADMRKPRIHRIFKLQITQGLSTLLTHQAELPAIIRQTQIKNLSVITSGPVSPSPGELLSSKSLMRALSMLRSMYDRIIIDCPPVMGIADASMVAPLSDGVIFVIKSGRTSKEIVLKAKKNLESIKARIKGVILNDVSRKLESSYYQYYSYYYAENPEK